MYVETETVMEIKKLKEAIEVLGKENADLRRALWLSIGMLKALDPQISSDIIDYVKAKFPDLKDDEIDE